MKQERLTRRNADGTTWVKCAVCDIQDKCDFTKETCCQELQDRLAELEDKIEQGTLIELPCKVGDTVCKYYKVENGIKIYSGTVNKIEMRKNGILIYITSLPNFYYDKAFIGDLNKAFIDTTCYYFCPVEEAEKRLKELQNG